MSHPMMRNSSLTGRNVGRSLPTAVSLSLSAMFIMIMGGCGESRVNNRNFAVDPNKVISADS
jgi:hypothetical protein